MSPSTSTDFHLKNHELLVQKQGTDTLLDELVAFFQGGDEPATNRKVSMPGYHFTRESAGLGVERRFRG